MRALLVVGLILLGACELYFDAADDRPDPRPYPVHSDGGGTTMPDSSAGNCAARVTCAPGAVCEPQCAPAGTRGCTEECHVACDIERSCADVDCGPGASCVEICNHDCAGMPWYCSQSCVPHAHPGTCGAASCERAAPACPAGTVPGVTAGCYSEFCIPSDRCGASDPGSCNAATVTCDAAPPACPIGTTPGVTGSCWSGFCLPASACACNALETQETCDARPDCFSITRGVDCVCEGELCSCQSIAGAFERCQSRS